MFYIPHGTYKLVDNVQQQFDARTYQWRIVPSSSLNFNYFNIQEEELSKEWFENNCHPNGVFKCNRCYRKHYIPDNFDTLCDGCSSILKDYHSQGLQFEFTEQFNAWYTNVPFDVVLTRIELRKTLDEVFKSDYLSYENKQIVIIRDPLKNNGDIEVCFFEDDLFDKKKRFILNVKEIKYEC